MSNRLIILDRDGVININGSGYISSLQQFELIPGSINAIVNICKLGYKVAVCTNQSAIARGFLSVEELYRINNYLIDLVEKAGGKIELIEFCPHHPDDNCRCRKPKTLMLERIANFCRVHDRSSVYMVGDSYTDILAIKFFGGIPVLVKTGHGLETIKQNIESTLIFEDLLDFANYLYNKDSHGD
jgi:D-glycero-D-manno-heptose 1,7-bisphosphate phosphatase